MKSSASQPKAALRKSAGGAAAKNGSRSKARSTVRAPRLAPTKASTGVQWTFLTNHSHVLVLLARDSSMVLRLVAQQVGITERAVQRIIADLEAGGIIERERIGRQNHYQIRANRRLRHPIESHRTIGDLLALLNEVR